MKQIRMIKTITLAALIAVGLVAQSGGVRAAGTETLTVAGGCFWCVEADFESVRGVKEVVSGFAGGKTANPTYKQVVAGGTGHYEAVQIQFDSGVINRDQVLAMFMRSIDPTCAPAFHQSVARRAPRSLSNNLNLTQSVLLEVAFLLCDN